LLLLKSFFLLSFLFLSLQAEHSLHLNDEQEIYSLNKGLFYFEDKDLNLNIDQISSDEMNFDVIKNKELSFGFSPSAFWFKVPILNQVTKKNKQWWLDIDYTLLDDIQVYQKIDKEINLLLHSGDGESFSHRPIQWRTFSTILETGSDSTLYIRVQTQSAMQVPIKIYSSEEIVKVKQAETLFFGFFYGVLLLIIFYNIFLFFVWHDKTYLYYIAFVGSFVLWQLCIDGLGHQYLWPDTRWINEKGALVFISMTIFSALMFTRRFLQLNSYAPGLSLVLVSLQGLMVTLLVSSFIFPYSIVIQILVWLTFPIPVVLLYAGVIALKHHYQYARFYIMGWSVFLGGSVLLSLNTLGVLPGYDLVRYLQPTGSMVEVVFFSLALAERIHLLRRQNIKTLSRLNSRLQSEVHEKVSEIREKDELLMQKFRLATMGEMLENISHQWKQPLHKLSLVMQNFYFRHKLEGSSEEELEKFNKQSSILLNYMSNTIDDFRNFFSPQKEKETFDIDENIQKVLSILSSSIDEQEIQIDINSKNSSKVKGYPNEFGQVLLNLFSNSKDAFVLNRIQDKKIKIDISETDDKIMVSFLDNAGGIPVKILPKVFDPYFSTKGLKEGSGIGLYMSKMIIENSMHGQFSVNNLDQGAEFTIALAKVV